MLRTKLYRFFLGDRRFAVLWQRAVRTECEKPAEEMAQESANNDSFGVQPLNAWQRWWIWPLIGKARRLPEDAYEAFLIDAKHHDIRYVLHSANQLMHKRKVPHGLE